MIITVTRLEDFDRFLETTGSSRIRRYRRSLGLALREPPATVHPVASYDH